MKLFVADKTEQGYVSATEYHWCDDNDLLMFGQFQIDNNNPSQVSMCGINSRKFTTHIIVKNVLITKDFYRELLTDSIEKSMKCKIDRKGDYHIDIAWGFHFNINDIVEELIEKASQFEVGDKIKCFGRKLTKIE